MPRLPSLCTPILYVALVLSAIGLATCFYGDTERNIERNPVVDTGVGASVIMPGQSAPAHPRPAAGSATPAGSRQEGGPRRSR